MAELYARPAAPAEGKTHGGFAEIARRLNALHPERPVPFSRQLVARWYECRESNDFPERHPVEVGGKVEVLFNLSAVDDWYTRWMRKRGGDNQPIETIPLFHVDQRGSYRMPPAVHPADVEQNGYRGRPEARESYRSSILDL